MERDKHGSAANHVNGQQGFLSFPWVRFRDPSASPDPDLLSGGSTGERLPSQPTEASNGSVQHEGYDEPMDTASPQQQMVRIPPPCFCV